MSCRSQRRNKCVIPFCTADQRKEVENLSLHNFPTCPSRVLVRNAWIDIVRGILGNDKWQPTKDTLICCRHFEEKALLFQGRRKMLDPGAVPSKFLTPAVVNVESPIHDTESGAGNELDVAVIEVDTEESELINQGQISNATKCLNADCPNCSCKLIIKLDGSDLAIVAVESEYDTCSKIPNVDLTPDPKKRKIDFQSRKRLFAESPLGSSSSNAYQSPPSLSVRKGKLLTPKSQRHLKRDHNYSFSPRKAADELKGVQAELLKWKKKAKSLAEKLNRRDKAQFSLKERLVEMKALSNSQVSDLEQQFPGLLKTIVTNEKTALNLKGKSGITYDEEMKKFAATLHFYSAKAYCFLRDHLTLPHPNTISSWMKSSDCGPGYNMDVLKRLSEARRIDTNNIMTDVVIMIDEMAIRKELIWNPSKHCYVGHIDYGTAETEMDCDSPLAGNALVLLIAGLSGGWKCPLGYIFTDKVDSDIQRSFVDKAFSLLEAEGFRVHSLTCDGNTANVAMFEAYGVVECPTNAEGEVDFAMIKTSFSNPANSEKNVYAIYDIVHMIKLWRNLLAQCGEITTAEGKQINWKYIEDVHKVQETEKIRAGNKLGRYHVQFQNHKMNVRLAVQAQSKSVADSIVFCRDDLKLPEFQDSEATSTFLYKLDKVFDILNSRNAAQKGQKAPLNRRNVYLQIVILEEFCKEVLQMKYVEVRSYKKTGKEVRIEKLLVHSMRKRAVIGMVVSIKSIIAISKELLFRSESPFKYVMTYRFSQDLIELFFNKIRGRLGRNNNPNVLEFQHIMKRIWHQNLLKSSNTGNCVEQMEEGSIPGGLLRLKPSPKTVPLEYDEIEDLDLHGFTQPKYSPFYTNCLAYIAGNVIRVVGTKMKCEVCAEGLLNNELDELDTSVRLLIQRKDRGGLFTPCQSVFKIVERSDAIFRNLVAESLGRMNISNLDSKIVRAVTSNFIGSSLFPHMQDHFVDFDPSDSESHVTFIIKSIVSHFLRIRLFDYGKRYQKFQDISTRHTFNKLTLFKHQ